MDINESVDSDNPLSKLKQELAQRGIKHTPDNIVSAAKDADNNIFFLEQGNERVGLEHILKRHENEFASRGISKEQIPSFVTAAVSEGKIMGKQGKNRPIYEVTYNGKIHRVAVTVGSNGFIVGANPAK